MEPKALTNEELNQALNMLHVAWSAIPGQGLVRVWQTTSFAEGFELARKLARLIEHYQSNPTLLVAGDTLQLVLTTPGAGGVTHRDVALAEAIDKLLD
ncbi:MAG: 4a-hydroxytetrahydrobiopterin dehydratase [Candidatus Saccharimonadales bacterium]